MRTTTVKWVWAEKVSPEAAAEQRERNHAKAVELAGELYKEDLSKEINQDEKSITFKRAWPNLETAQAWVDYVLAEGAAEAQVDPE